MTNSNTPLPAAGWYPDPAGSPRTRWWNGSVWSDSYGEPARPAAQPATQPNTQPGTQVAAPVTPWASPSSDPAYAPTSHASVPYTPMAAGAPLPNAPYANAPAYGAVEPLKAPLGTSPYTPFVWPLALLPILSNITNLLGLTDMRSAIDDVLAGTTRGQLDTGLQIGSSLVSWVAIGLAILFAVLDYRALKRAGVPKPFHWAWIFFAIISAPVYMIGRSVVVRRRVGSGLAPLFVNLALYLVNYTLVIVAIVVAFAVVIPLIDIY